MQAAKSGTPIRIAVFASGTGSNFQAIVDEAEAGRLPAEVRLLVTDRPKARAVERAKKHGIPVFAFRAKDYPSREAYEQEILERLKAERIDLVVLAGYMRIITPVLVEAYAGRMINIHPSLLPAFPGLDAIGQAYRHGVKVTGVTVHVVDGGMDTGPIIAQKAVEIGENEPMEALEQRIHEVEHQMYPEVIRWVSEERLHIEGRRVVVTRD